MSTTDDLLGYLKHMTEFFKPPMCPLERLVLEHGQDFTPAKRPRGVRKQADRHCFMNSTHLAMQRNLDYVEGYAVHYNVCLPVFHAWCITEDGTVVDVTWRYPEKSVYRGVIIPRKILTTSLIKQKYYGVLDNGLTINMDVIEQLVKLQAKGAA